MDPGHPPQGATVAGYDAIVIGSGIGGLTAAGLLAGVAGKRVLVLEKHMTPGGLTHAFRRDGASWDVGLHYVGELNAGSQIRAYFDYLSGGELTWNKLPADFDRFVYPGLELRVPSDRRLYKQRLVDLFPEEAPAIRAYFRDLAAAARWMIFGYMRDMVPRPLEPVVALWRRITGALPLQTTGEYLERRFRSPMLRSLVSSQWGDYGLPPCRSAFAIHAQIVSHYLDGAWFPDGGAARIARTFEKGIERAGGALLVGQEVTRILVEGGRAVGVTAINRRGGGREEIVHRAPIVISDAGVPATFRQLLPSDGMLAQSCAPHRALGDHLGGGLSAVTLYLRLGASPSSLGIHGENFWINADFDHDALEAQSSGVMEGRPRRIYVSFPSIKAGDDRFHTAEIIAFVEPKAFRPWRDRPKGNRGADYSAIKHRIAEGLVDLAETAIPGLRSMISYSELATPLTVEHYTSHPDGCFYGLPSTPARFMSDVPRARTPVPGLVLSGSDAACLGIGGALMGGVAAACQVLGASGFPLIQRAVRKNRHSGGTVDLPRHKRRAVLQAKRRLTPSIWSMEFLLDRPADDYLPGQFARLHVGHDEWRDYSIAGMEGHRVRFLISTRTGGRGSCFVEAAEPGETTVLELPLGDFRLEASANRRIFVATGTGIAPFMPMFVALDRSGDLPDAVLLFGARTAAEDLTTMLQPMPGGVVSCISGDREPDAGRFSGRVTDALEELEFDPGRTDFYLCGSSAMVADAKSVLESRGARHIFFEAF